jgi:hypothetical protein
VCKHSLNFLTPNRIHIDIDALRLCKRFCVPQHLQIGGTQNLNAAAIDVIAAAALPIADNHRHRLAGKIVLCAIACGEGCRQSACTKNSEARAGSSRILPSLILSRKTHV